MISIARISQFRTSLSVSGSFSRKLIDATLGTAGVHFAGMVLAFIVGVQLARYLGPENYGIYGAMMSLITLLSAFGQLGLPQLVVREISGGLAQSQFRRIRGALFSFTLAVTICAGLAALFGIAIYEFWFTGSATKESEAYWIFLNVPLFALSLFLGGVLLGFHRTAESQLYEALLRPALFAFFMFTAHSIAGSLTPVEAFQLQALAVFIAVLLAALAIWRILPRAIGEAAPLTPYTAWTSEAMPLYGTEIIRTLDGQYAVLMLGLMVAPGDVGLFRIALSITLLFIVPITILNFVPMPWVAKLAAEKDFARIQMMASGASITMVIITLTMTIGVYLFGEVIVTQVFGAIYAPAWFTLLLLSLAACTESWFAAATPILNMSGSARLVIRAYAFSFSFGVPVACTLTYGYGIVGMAAAIILTRLVRGLYLWRLCLMTTGINTAPWSALHLLRFDKEMVNMPQQPTIKRNI